MGGSGGGSSTSVTYMYPEWVRSYYERANNATWADAEAAKANNPYKSTPVSISDFISGLTGIGRWADKQVYAYDPKDLFDLLLKGPDNIPDSIFSIFKRSEIQDAIRGQAAPIIKTIDEEVLPKYRRAMQTIGAVNTSAFKIGEALLWRGQLDSLNTQYYDKIIVPAINRIFDTTERMQEFYIKKLALILTYAELQMKIDENIYKVRQGEADLWNSFRVSQSSWGLDIDKMLVMAAGSWQSTPQSSETKTKQQESSSGLLGGILGIGSLVTGLFKGW